MSDSIYDTPLICDLDGTLIKTDTTFELCLLHVKAHPFWGWLQLLLWFSCSKSQAKTTLAARYAGDINPNVLPYTNLLEYDVVKAYRTKELVSGSHDTLVKKVAANIGVFVSATGTTYGTNLIGQVKAEYLQNAHPDGFDYVGDSCADIPVWKAARKAYAFNVSQATLDAAKAEGLTPEVLFQKHKSLRPLLTGMRLHQWSKNLLLAFLPLMSLAQADLSWIPTILLGFTAFGLVASSTYLFNDLLDIQSDRAHPTKSARSFASGALSVLSGIKAIAASAGLGFALALAVGLPFAIMVLIYGVISVSYSFKLKSVAVLDVNVLAFLFCWRILSGSVMVDVQADTWLMLALGFFFLSLAVGKRVIELAKLPPNQTAQNGAVVGRDYYIEDLSVILNLGVGAGFASIIIVLIYAFLSGPTIIGRDISAILIIVVLTFWQMRFWLMVSRKQVNHDPVVFALKDRVSLSLFGTLIVIIVFEQLIPAGGGY